MKNTKQLSLLLLFILLVLKLPAQGTYNQDSLINAGFKTGSDLVISGN